MPSTTLTTSSSISIIFVVLYGACYIWHLCHQRRLCCCMTHLRHLFHLQHSRRHSRHEICTTFTNINHLDHLSSTISTTVMAFANLLCHDLWHPRHLAIHGILDIKTLLTFTSSTLSKTVMLHDTSTTSIASTAFTTCIHDMKSARHLRHLRCYEHKSSRASTI